MNNSTTEITAQSATTTFLHALAFVLGFSLIFIVGWGGAATLLGQFFRAYKHEIAQIGGIVVILFGLYNLGILKLRFLSYDTRPSWNNKLKHSSFWSSGLMGVFFAAGWTPCIGTTLGAILTLGISQDGSAQAMYLASAYALGLGIPFLLIGLGISRMSNYLRKFRRHLRKMQIISGLLLILIGVLLLSNQLTLIAIWAQRNGLYLDLAFGGAGVPSYTIAILAGLVSFLSPCVLPLVPAYIGYLSGQAVREYKY